MTTLQQELREEMPTKIVGRTPSSGINEVDWDWQKVDDQRKKAATALDTLEAEVARLRQVIAQAGDNIELQEAEQRGFLRGQATPLSAQEDVGHKRNAIDVAVGGWILRQKDKGREQVDLDEVSDVRRVADEAITLSSTDRERGLEEAGNAVDLGIAKAKHRCEHWLGRLEAGIDDQEMTFERIIDELRNAGAISDSLKRSQEKAG